MSKYSFCAKFKTQPGKRDEFINILSAAATGMIGVAACHLYFIHTDKADEDLTCVYELWDSKEEHDASLQVPGAMELIGKAMPLLAGRPETMEWEAIAGKGF